MFKNQFFPQFSLQNKLDPAEDYFGSGGIFSICVYSMLASLTLFCVVGCVWELCKRKHSTLMKEGNGKRISNDECIRERIEQLRSNKQQRTRTLH